MRGKEGGRKEKDGIVGNKSKDVWREDKGVEVDLVNKTSRPGFTYEKKSQPCSIQIFFKIGS